MGATDASAALTASGVGGEIREAIQAGMEVTFHERGINAHGWSGTSYSIVDPETGVGSYLIEGKGNGAYFLGVVNGFGLGVMLGAWVIGLSSALLLVLGVLLVASIFATLFAMAKTGAEESITSCYFGGVNTGLWAYEATMGIAIALGAKFKEIFGRLVFVTIGKGVNQVAGPADAKVWQCY